MLQAPSNIGIGQSQQQAEHEAWDSYDEIFMKLSVDGFDPPGQPPFACPQINPETYTQLEGDAYSILMGKVDAWFAYTGATLAMVKGRLDTIRNEMSMMGVDLRKQVRLEVEAKTRKKPSESEMKDLLQELPHYRELLRLEQDYYIMQRHLDAQLEGLERHARGLSRQVTLRGQSIELGGAAGGRRGQRRLTE